jgi:microcystin degradation protein MlrC
MRIAALGIFHETNTFQSVKTDYDSFANFEFLRGSEIADRHANSLSPILIAEEAII